MKLGIIIFLLSLIVRVINLFFLDLNEDTYIIEDQTLYWEWSLQFAYLPWSEIPNNILSERMPGSFLFFEAIQWITNKNIFLILTIQAIVASFTCVIISSCAYMINNRYGLYTGLFAAFSPLLIIISSQILSDTIFLFAFVSSLFFILKYCYTSKKEYFILLSGLFLGVTTFIRAATFPFIFLCLPIIYFMIKSKTNKSLPKVLILLFLFLCSALGPISPRLYDNIVNNDSFVLTSQAGSHVAYWMVPGILLFTKGLNRESAVNYVNTEIDKAGGLKGNSYKDSKILMEVSKNIISNQNIFITAYTWARSSILNTITPPILIDSRVRAMKHPSFAQEAGLKSWLYNLFLNKDYLQYTNVVIISLFFTIFSFITFFYGFYVFFKDNYILSLLSLCIVIYFCIITGPTISPKYCLPYAPIIFYLQAIFLDKLMLFCKKRKYG